MQYLESNEFMSKQLKTIHFLGRKNVHLLILGFINYAIANLPD